MAGHNKIVNMLWPRIRVLTFVSVLRKISRIYS
ncbi:unnamed protein product [Schistosoma curassoni]|uniref:Acetyltransferase n=1 Tax=Schistosoma curassoni TaxID=6186 RepID=A0A183JE68_9TREM|nr:unnamed protein product [Schistosoma curassoni]